MIRLPRSHRNCVPLARILASLGSRAATIADITGLPANIVRDICTTVTNAPPKPGQRPKDITWFFGAQERRRHAALLLLLFYTYLSQYSNLENSRAISSTLAYRFYCRVIGKEPLISMERFQILTQAFSLSWRDIPRGRTSTQVGKDNFKVMSCKKCGIPHVVEAHYLNYYCQACEKKNRANRKTNKQTGEN